MTDDLIPRDLREFILRHINSIAELEALLLMWRQTSDTWSAESIAQRLYITRDETIGVLEHLRAGSLITCLDDKYCFNAQSQELRLMVDRLAETYSRHLIPVTRLIHEKPRGLREFADAFKLTKERP